MFGWFVDSMFLCCVALAPLSRLWSNILQQMFVENVNCSQVWNRERSARVRFVLRQT